MLKNDESQSIGKDYISHMKWKIKTVWNHQPVMVSSMPSQVSHSLPKTLAAEIAMEKPSWKIVKQSREPVGIKVHEYCTLAINYWPTTSYVPIWRMKLAKITTFTPPKSFLGLVVSPYLPFTAHSPSIQQHREKILLLMFDSSQCLMGAIRLYTI